RGAIRADRGCAAPGAGRGGRADGAMELTVESLIAELGLQLACGQEAAKAHVRWVHSTELPDPTPWLRGGELLLTTGVQLETPQAQRELIERLADHEIVGLGFGTGFRHKRIPAALVAAARERSFPLFEVPYELPFIAITERAFAQLLNERYEILQRNLAGDVLAEALTGHLYPEEVQARLRPFGIGEQVAVLAFQLDDPSSAAALLERILERERVRSLVAIRGGRTSWPPRSPPIATSAPSSCSSRCKTTTPWSPTAAACSGRSNRARATMAASCCAR